MAPITGKQLWSRSGEVEYPYKDIESILGAVTRLPVRYWKPRMLFYGARDRELITGLNPMSDHSFIEAFMDALRENVAGRQPAG